MKCGKHCPMVMYWWDRAGQAHWSWDKQASSTQWHMTMNGSLCEYWQMERVPTTEALLSWYTSKKAGTKIYAWNAELFVDRTLWLTSISLKRHCFLSVTLLLLSKRLTTPIRICTSILTIFKTVQFCFAY